MKITDNNIYQQAYAIIRELYGANAKFRDGQYEAIEATLKNRRTLVVQKTGWGKSLVYFACTKLLRSQGKGVTMVVSPLLALMANQLDAAKTLGLRCDVLNSTVRERRAEILDQLEHDALDLVFVTPETLFTDEVQSSLKNIRIGLFVIDEAHCISDWGFDFRLEYGNLRKIVVALPQNVPVLATTATATDRVIEDLRVQLGGDVYVSRGPLMRDSLYIQVLDLPDKVSRYAWILDSLRLLPGSGIIYCLTQRDCDYLCDFLTRNGISAAAYYSRGSQEGAAENFLIEERFQNNQIKVIVATIKLGMGYDKGDIAFIIHFQMPKNIVSYYQQIGRAGRNIDKAYTFLMCGNEDDEIHNYFIDKAFPTEEETQKLMAYLSSRDGAKLSEILSHFNFRRDRIEKALTFLQHDGFIQKSGSSYYITPKPFFYDKEHYDAISAIRRNELQQMKQMANTKACYSRFVVSALDDKTATDCGHCANCLQIPLFSQTASAQSIAIAEQYLNGLILPIEPRKIWADASQMPSSKIQYQNQPGLCLSKYGDAGIGALVKRDKYSAKRQFCEELVGKSAAVLRPLIVEKGITHLCYVPSLRSGIVKNFSERLATALGIPCVDLLEKTAAAPQKDMENSVHQCTNAVSSFSVKNGVTLPEKVILVDDIVDSRWTLTVCGYRLMESGTIEVYPFALASSSNREG